MFILLSRIDKLRLTFRLSLIFFTLIFNINSNTKNSLRRACLKLGR